MDKTLKLKLPKNRKIEMNLKMTVEPVEEDEIKIPKKVKEDLDGMYFDNLMKPFTGKMKYRIKRFKKKYCKKFKKELEDSDI